MKKNGARLQKQKGDRAETMRQFTLNLDGRRCSSTTLNPATPGDEMWDAVER